MKSVLPVLVVAAVLLAGCSAPAAEEEPESSPRAAAAQTPTPTPTVIAPVAPVIAAPPPPAPVTAPALAQIDYVSPVVNRWGGCFSRLGVGDIYYDSLSSTVTGAWNGGALTWTVGPGNSSGTPADQQSIDALASC